MRSKKHCNASLKDSAPLGLYGSPLKGLPTSGKPFVCLPA
jgi:hypothetical protein